MMMSGMFLAAAEGGWKLVENVRSEGAKLLELDIRLSTVLILCGLMLVIVFFVGWNKYAYRDGRIREKAGYADDFMIESTVGIYCLLMGFISLRPAIRAAEKIMGGMFASIMLVIFLWIAYALLALCVGYLGAGLKKKRVLRQKRIYNIRQMFWRIDQKSKF